MNAVAEAAQTFGPGPEVSADATDRWAALAPRVLAYLKALGVRDPLDIERLSARVRARLENHRAMRQAEDPSEAAIEETAALLDEWIATELGVEPEQNVLATARAAVLGGTVPRWPQRWSGVWGESVAQQVRAASVQPVPPLAPLGMAPQPIRLFWRTLTKGVARVLLRIVHPRGGRVSKQRVKPPPVRAAPRRAEDLYQRAIYFVLVTVTTVGAISLLGWAFLDNGLTPLELALLVLYAILILWISASFWTATIGFVMLLTERDSYSIAKLGDGRTVSRSLS
jgi:hypothetical protein